MFISLFSRNIVHELYLIQGRLEDVVALIQVLGLGVHAGHGENALIQILGPPRSNPNGTWTEVVRSHPELFRAAGGVEGHEQLRLALRWFQPDPQAPVDLPVLELLMKTAIELHESAVHRDERIK